MNFPLKPQKTNSCAGKHGSEAFSIRFIETRQLRPGKLNEANEAFDHKHRNEAAVTGELLMSAISILVPDHLIKLK